MLQLAEHADLGQVAREQQAAVQAGIESTQMVDVVVFHLHLSQHLVPGGLGIHLHLFKRVVHLAQVQAGLLHIDEGGSHLHLHHLSFGGRERDHTHVFGCLLYREGRVALDKDVVAEIRGHSPVVVHRPGADGMVVHHLYLAAFIGVHHQVRLLALRVGEAEPGGMGCRHQFGGYVVVGQIDTVIIRLGHFCLVGEPTGALVLVKVWTRGHRHQAEGAVVVDPGAGLVSLLEATDVRGVVAVRPSVSVLARLGCPEMGAPRNGNGRIGVSGTKVIGRERASQGIHVLCPVANTLGRGFNGGLGARCRQQRQCRQGY